MRIRTIKPDFWRSESMSSVSAEAALLAIGLLNAADDEGYFLANPKLLMADIFPLRECYGSIPGMLTELSKIGFIRVISGPDGRDYGLVVNFNEHQSINKPVPSKIKRLLRLPEDSRSPTGGLPPGREGKGRERNSVSNETLVEAGASTGEVRKLKIIEPAEPIKPDKPAAHPAEPGPTTQPTTQPTAMPTAPLIASLTVLPTAPPGDDSDEGAIDDPGDEVAGCPQQKIVELWEARMPELPRVVVWNAADATALRSRWRWLLANKRRSGAPYFADEQGGLEWFGRLFEHLRKSDFLMNRAGNFNGFTLKWLVKSANFAKCLEGNYDAKEAA